MKYFVIYQPCKILTTISNGDDESHKECAIFVNFPHKYIHVLALLLPHKIFKLI